MDVTFQGNSKKGTTTWLTPKYIIDALGPFDLDPCAHTTMPWRTATTMLTIKEDGLKTPWAKDAYTFMNPPYTTEGMQYWMAKMQDHGNGISLCFSSTEVDWFDFIWNADAVLFKKGRIPFLNEFGIVPVSEKTGAKQGPGKGSVFAAWGEHAISKLHIANVKGIIPGEFKVQK